MQVSAPLLTLSMVVHGHFPILGLDFPHKNTSELLLIPLDPVQLPPLCEPSRFPQAVCGSLLGVPPAPHGTWYNHSSMIAAITSSITLGLSLSLLDSEPLEDRL